MITLTAPAKVNVLLSVGERREDGLHELVSVMQAISLADTVRLAPADGLRVDGGPEGPGNLAARAASALAALHGRAPDVAIEIDKRIPIGAGMAGGSADAAAVLVGLKQLWGLSVSRKALEKIGAGLGADVPFCVRGGTAVARGSGEDLSPLGCRDAVWWVLGIAPFELSTAAVYAEYDALGGGTLGDPFEVADALARGDVVRLARALRNDLEVAALSLVPALTAGRDALLTGGALAALLSGSGPTWLGLARDEAHAREVAGAVSGAFARVEVAHSVAHGARVEPERPT